PAGGRERSLCMKHPNLPVALLLAAITALILGFIARARRQSLYIRRIPGLSAVEEAVGRAVEMGRPITFSLGLGQWGQADGIILREKAASNFMFGRFFAESLILAEAGQSVGAIQVAGTPSTTQIPFFIASCDYTIIGDEFYAGSAYLTREPVLLGSLIGQDYGKVMMLAIIVAGILAVRFYPTAAA